jgi:hypothetical protein
MVDFSQPGSDGEAGSELNRWRKGLVYTLKRDLPTLLRTGHDCRMTVAFKTGAAPAPALTDFGRLYRRLTAIAAARITHLGCAGRGESLQKAVLCNGWRTIGNTNQVATAFITMGMSCSVQDGLNPCGQEPPSAEELLSPGGATLEELTRFAPQRVDEIYNEFDFAEKSSPRSDAITLSYGESAPFCAGIDFKPFLERAEKLAGFYHGLLQTFGEVTSQSLTILGRQWFCVTNPNLVTVQVYFQG